MAENDAISNPPKIFSDLQKAQDDFKVLTATYDNLSEEDKSRFNQSHPGILNNKPQPTSSPQAALTGSSKDPSQAVVDLAWRWIIRAFVAVFALAAAGIIFAAIVPFWVKPSATINTDILITIFSTTVGYLAGVLTPKPGSSKQ